MPTKTNAPAKETDTTLDQLYTAAVVVARGVKGLEEMLPSRVADESQRKKIAGFLAIHAEKLVAAKENIGAALGGTKKPEIDAKPFADLIKADLEWAGQPGKTVQENAEKVKELLGKKK